VSVVVEGSSKGSTVSRAGNLDTNGWIDFSRTSRLGKEVPKELSVVRAMPKQQSESGLSLKLPSQKNGWGLSEFLQLRVFHESIF
jgi:hypothetical protein